MPNYTLPFFGTAFNAYYPLGTPPTPSTSSIPFMGQLYVLSKSDGLPASPVSGGYSPQVTIRIAKEDLALLGLPLVNLYMGYTDAFGNKWFYIVRAWEYIHQGFPNCYVSLSVDQTDNIGSIPDPNR